MSNTTPTLEQTAHGLMSACDAFDREIDKTLKMMDESQKREQAIFDEMAQATADLQAHINAACLS